MEATTADATANERYASGGPGRGLHAQNLAFAFRQTVDRIGDDPAIIAGEGDDRVELTWNEVDAHVAADRRRPREPRASRRATPSRSCSTTGPSSSRSTSRAVSLGARPVLDLPDVLAGADPVRLLRRRGQGRDRRERLPRRLQRGAQGPAGDRAPDRRSTATAATTRSSRSRRSTPSSTPPSRSRTSSPTTC